MHWTGVQVLTRVCREQPSKQNVLACEAGYGIHWLCHSCLRVHFKHTTAMQAIRLKQSIVIVTPMPQCHMLFRANACAMQG